MKKVVIIMLMLAGTTLARYHEVRNANQFEAIVDTYPYSLVCFAPATKMANEDLDRGDFLDRKQDYRSLRNLIRSASQKSEYKNFLPKDVGFILVDTSSKHSAHLSSQYHVSNEPTCFVFQQGSPENSKKVVRPTSAKSVLSMLEMVGGSDLKNILKERKEESVLDRQERIARYYAYGATYPYWGGPYGYHWGIGPYWRRWHGWYW